MYQNLAEKHGKINTKGANVKMEHSSLELIKECKKLGTKEVNSLAAEAIDMSERLQEQLRSLQQKYRELSETNLQIATVQSLQKSIDEMVNLFRDYIAKDNAVLDKENKLLEELSRALGE